MIERYKQFHKSNMKLTDIKRIKRDSLKKVLQFHAKNIADDARSPVGPPSEFWIKHLAERRAEILARNYGIDVNTILKIMVKYAMKYLQGEAK